MVDAEGGKSSSRGMPSARPRRRGLAVLALLSLLLFVLATAHVCKDLNDHECCTNFGNYSGAAHIASYDPDTSTDTLTARSNGYESCNLVDEEDWDDYVIAIGPMVVGPWPGFTYANAGDSGGYNEDWWGDCLVEHRLWWNMYVSWAGIHDQTGDDDDTFCYDLAGNKGTVLGCL